MAVKGLSDVRSPRLQHMGKKPSSKIFYTKIRGLFIKWCPQSTSVTPQIFYTKIRGLFIKWCPLSTSVTLKIFYTKIRGLFIKWCPLSTSVTPQIVYTKIRWLFIKWCPLSTSVTHLQDPGTEDRISSVTAYCWCVAEYTKCCSLMMSGLNICNTLAWPCHRRYSTPRYILLIGYTKIRGLFIKWCPQSTPLTHRHDPVTEDSLHQDTRVGH